MRKLRHFIASALLPLSLSYTAFLSADTAQPLALKEDAPKTYTVIKGDTLWDISALYLDSPWLWPRLWQVNPDIDNPHLIYPGDKLTLIWKNGQPVLSLKPMVKLSPKVRVLEKEAVPTVRETLVLPYIESDRLMDTMELTKVNRVLGTSDGRKYLTQNDSVFINGAHTDVNWAIYRVMSEFNRNSSTGIESSVVALKRIATAELKESGDVFSGLTVLNQNQEILVNDIALPDSLNAASSLSTTFYPLPSPQNSFANILGSLEGGQYAGKNQIVVIDRGLDDKVRQGSVFELFKNGTVIYKYDGQFSYDGGRLDEQVTLPESRVGNLMVIRPYERFSLALITDSTGPISTKEKALSPQFTAGYDHDNE
ncbi:LysM peptidoglycan-binding domain-containing protein [Vibrio sp.]|nr:LysM peptidoglycan-binding domain-containing protein [Vibrio sp.]